VFFLTESSTKASRATDNNRYRFVSRKPFFRTTTLRIEAETEEAADQTKESSNQQSLEENFENNDTTELGDIAVALHEIQHAPLPSKISPTTNTPSRIKSTRTPSRSRIRYSTTVSPIPLTTKKFIVRKVKPQAFEKVNPIISNTFRPFAEYDYYDDEQMSILGKIPEHSKVLLHSNGVIECLDQGNFPHPVSCKKFISCAKMENGKVLGWEYTCPKNLSFDPIGGICNWSAGLGCNE
ncbi:CBM 14 domain containing protein, partial [Asbolus verrucosus]